MKLTVHCDSCFGRGYQPNEAETGLEPCSDCDGEGGKSYTFGFQRAGTVRLLLAVLASPTEEEAEVGEGRALLPFKEGRIK